MSVNEQHAIVKNSLSQFIKKNIPGANLKNVDEIVLEYVISILEDVQDESFDVEAFQEMMSAYFADFAKIDPAVICTWVFDLESQLSKLDEPKMKNNEKPSINLDSLRLTDMIPEERLLARQLSHPTQNSNECMENNGHIRRIQHLSETSDGSGSTDSNCDLFLEECDRLQEMFPESTSMEIKYCMTIANGDVEKARQIIIHRQESGQSFHNTPRTHIKHSKIVDEKELKNRIIERYSYVDQSEQPREYRPVIPKVEPKKMIRYRDNKIVSLKGERYTENDGGEPRKPKKVQP